MTEELSQTPAQSLAPPTFGDALRNAREAAGMSAATLAGRLRLHVRQIEALERSDLAALPRLIYVRGFVRSCARELRIDPGPLLADLDRVAGVSATTGPEPSGDGFTFSRFGDGARPIVILALGALVIAGAVGTLMPRRATPVPAPAVPAPIAAPSAVSQAGAPEPPKDEAVPANGGNGQGKSAPAPSAASPAKIEAPAPMPAATPADSGPNAKQAGAPADGAQHSKAAAGTGADDAVLVLRAHADAWVEVIQYDGTTLLSQILSAGSVQTVKARQPLRLVIGNSAAVEAQFRGAPLDLRPHASQNGVARLNVE